MRYVKTETLGYSFRSVARRCLDLLFPPRCAGCQGSGHLLCPTCLESMQPMTLPMCAHCGLPLAPQNLCSACQIYQLRLSGLRAVNTYQGSLRSCVHALKYAGQTRLAEPLGHLLAEAYQSYGMTADVLVPVPLHPERQQQRGYNHAALLARVCAAHIGTPYLPNIIMRRRSTLAQVGLSGRERRQNVQDAFACASPQAVNLIAGRKILIIDDVCTTGATLEACAAPLFAVGAREVWGLVLARPFTSSCP